MSSKRKNKRKHMQALLRDMDEDSEEESESMVHTHQGPTGHIHLMGS